jgi:hypothetical protein
MSYIIQDDEIDYSDPYDIELKHDVKYTWDTLLEMVCGTQYYSNSELLYTYLKINKLEEEAEHVLIDLAKQLKQNQRKVLKRMEKRQEDKKEKVLIETVEETKED